MIKTYLSSILITLLFVGFFSINNISTPTPIYAQEITQLEAQIQAQKDKLQNLDNEIANQQAKITQAVGEGNSLKQAVSALESSEEKLSAEIQKTKTVIMLFLARFIQEIPKCQMCDKKDDGINTCLDIVRYILMYLNKDFICIVYDFAFVLNS